MQFKFHIDVLFVLLIGGFFSSLGATTKIITPSDNLMAAVSSLQPGDILQLRGGSYGSISNATIKGTSSARIVIQSYPGETAILSSFSLNGGAYIDLQSVVVDARNSINEAIWMGNGANNNRVLSCELRNAKQQGVLLPHAGDGPNQFINCKIHHNGSTANYDHGMYIASTGNLIDSCEIYANAAGAVQFYNGYPGERCNRNVLKNSKIYGNATLGAGDAVSINSGDDNQVLNNYVEHRNTGIAVAWRNPIRTIVKGNFVTKSNIGVDVLSSAQNTQILENKLCGNQTNYRNSGAGTVYVPGQCDGGIAPPPATNLDVSQTQLPPPEQPPSTGGGSASGISAPLLVAGVLAAALILGGN